MKISLNWLRDYVATDLDADALAELLTMSGLEVEAVERTGPALDGVVVGHVLDTRPHPNADRLTLCDVDLGDDEPLQIVCGAPNVAPGQKVAVATVGATLMLPDRETGAPTPVEIRRSKIRGEVSNGMICAEDELGLGDDHAGILVLDEDAEVGEPFARYLQRHGRTVGDAVLDVAVTPNRPDATSHLGVARDVAALLDLPLLLPEVDEPTTEGEASFSVEITDPEGCPRYVGLVVRGVRVGPSPEWLADRLRAIGLRPINNVVDVTNYVLHEMGQPLHAFDLARLAGPRIVVRRSRPGEVLTTLDDQERKLPAGTLLICDAEKPVAVAGVMGGANSEVTETTTDVLIESAYFDPVSIRKAAKALGLQTDASYRFERGVDPTAQLQAAARAAALLAEVAGGTVEAPAVDANPVPYVPRTLTVRPGRVAHVLGAEVPEEDLRRLLTAIGFVIEEAEEQEMDAFAEEVMRSESLAAAVAEAEEAGLHVTAPPFRPDVEREVDVIEEVARLWGYDRIPEPATAAVPLAPAGDTPEAAILDRVRTRLVGLGFRELYTNSLVPKATAEAFATTELTGAAVTPVETLNPISQDMAALRPSLLPGLLAAVAYNQARGADALRFFELGHVYGRGDDPAAPVEGYHEHTSLIVGITGPAERKGWAADGREADFFDLKGALLHVLDALALPERQEIPSTEPDALTAYRLFLDAGGRRLGVLGRLSDGLAARYDLQAPLYFAELDADLLAALARREAPVRYAPISRFPAVDRDLAVLVDEAQPVGPLLDTIRAAAGGLLQSVRLFDLYRGERIAAGQKSVAFALRFGADRTLRDEEVDGRMRKVVAALERAHGARLRG